MNEKEWLTVLAAEKETRIPNATIRRYIRNHGHHLNIKKKGKSYFIATDSIKVMKDIRKLYDEGKSLEQVEESLVNMGVPMTITVTEDDERMTVDVGEALQDLKEGMNKQNEIIQSLVEQINRQQEYIDTKLEDRDRRLMAAIREAQEVKEIAAAQEEKKKEDKPVEKKGWLTRLFRS